MSTKAATPASTGAAAPWRQSFLAHISKMDSPEFVLSTLAPSTSPDSPVPFVPRARYCVYRGMWGMLPENKHNELPKNDAVYESDMLTFTTDARMSKVPELFATSAGFGDVEQSRGSGGGGAVEAVFWVKEAAKTQWRFKGRAYIIGPDIEGPGAESSGSRTVKSKLGERMRVIKEDGKGDWSWQRELSAHFNNLAPYMKGSFKNPPPGTPKTEAPKSGEGMGQEVKGSLEDDEIASRNFRVVVIRVDEVDQVDLSEPDKALRWKFTYVGPSGGEVGEWEKEELWP